MSEPPNAPMLAGLRVVELATYIFAPAAAMALGDFGAEVIKVEVPGAGDPNRRLHAVPPLPVSDVEYCFLLDARNKKFVALDLKSPEGAGAMRRLVESADVFVTNFRPSALARLRLGYDDLRESCPRLVYAHATGYGLAGEEVEKPGYDMTAYWPRSGLMDSVRNADADPAINLCGMGDHPSAITLFAGIMLALYARDRTGKGTLVSTSLMANGAWSNGSFLQGALVGAEPYRRGTRLTAANVMINHYIAADGARFMICAPDGEKSWPGFCRALGHPEWERDPRYAAAIARRENSAGLIAQADDLFRSRPMAEWRETLRAHEIPWSPIATNEEVARDPQMLANDVFIGMDHPTLGRVRTVNTPVNVGSCPKVAPRPPRGVGSDTREVLESLGLAEAEITAILAAPQAREPH